MYSLVENLSSFQIGGVFCNRKFSELIDIYDNKWPDFTGIK